MKPAAESIRESEVRAMRDRVYDQKSSDANWEGCKEHWLSPNGLKFLHEHRARMDLIITELTDQRGAGSVK